MIWKKKLSLLCKYTLNHIIVYVWKINLKILELCINCVDYHFYTQWCCKVSFEERNFNGEHRTVICQRLTPFSSLILYVTYFLDIMMLRCKLYLDVMVSSSVACDLLHACHYVINHLDHNENIQRTEKK